MRQQGVEHLGQVRVGLLETDGKFSMLFFHDGATRYGLPLFPKACQPVYRTTPNTYYACMYRVGMSVYLNTPMKPVRVVITNNGHWQSILHIAAENMLILAATHLYAT